MNQNKKYLELAKEAAKLSYSPYSNFPVGACAVFQSGNLYTGCNIENSSYGLSLCAERNAISSAIASGEHSFLIKIAIYSPKSTKCFPCGACRQWIQEFAHGFNTEIILENEIHEPSSFFINDLLPFSFQLI